jgi:predicted AAA+ superfamily ATPase
VGAQRAFSSDDAARALDTIERLLHAVGAVDSAEDVRKLRVDLQRTVFEDQTRKQVKRTTVTLDPGSGLRPWREVIRPHDDVARGEFTASEFAADLHLVRTGQATSPEYGDPVEFFTRTYLTEGLRDLLSRALRRVGGGDGNASPVVNLQTNFGGGKTHSMLALYHLFSGTPAKDFPQELQELIAETGNPDLAALGVKRVALVGTYLKAGSPLIKDDGTEVRTLWGELAWQLGGREAYDLIAEDDRAGTNPGEALRTLTAKYSPALILIDEWVAYARQLVTDKELPSGSFETQFTFAQSLTEVVRSVPGAMLVVSIPASDTGDAGSGSDIEIGGANGQLALERLQNVIRRVADQWRPSSKDESFEIVRRRLFQAPNAEGLTTISAVARSFVTLYRSNTALFPRDAAAPSDDYEQRIRASYPLHPELLDRLYEDWSTLERFQRTRGVLKLVSSIVHELWPPTTLLR